MKTRVSVFFHAFVAIVFMQFAYATGAGPETSADAAARVQALEKELSAAKGKVAELEAELAAAQKTIGQLKDQNAAVAANNRPQAAGPASQTVSGHPLYDAYNPQTPVAQADVIAEKFTPGLQQEPAAVTRLLKDDLTRNHIRDITRLSDLVPNMQYGQAGNEAKLAIRGARTNRTGAEADPAVAIYEDGISVPTTTQALEPYVDVKSIEVMRGPQGVMFGRNAFGGVINILSNEPDPSGWDAAFEGEYGYADGLRFDAMLNIPVTETVSTRIAARYDIHSGYVDNRVLEGDADDLLDRKQQYVRWMTKWQPTDNFNLMVNLISYDQNQTGSGIWGYHQAGAYVGGQYQPGNVIAPPGAHPDIDGWHVSRNFASLADQENLSGTLKLNWDIGFAAMQWYINKSKFENRQVFDNDYSDGGPEYSSDFSGWDSFRDTLSSELRFASNSEGRFDWVAGVYYLDMQSNWGWLETVDGETSQPAWDYTDDYKTDSTSVFARAGFDITDDFRASAGVRWYDDSKTLRDGSKDSWNGVLWNAALQYRINDDMHAYFSVSTGYRPGGINYYPGEPATVPINYDSENVTAYELGLKSLFMDGALALNLAAFLNDYKDMQAQSFRVLPLPGSAGLMDYISTAGKMESKGFEAEIQWLPGSRWNISANLAWLDAQFKDYIVPAIDGLGDIEGHTMGDTINLNGWRPAMSPEWSATVQASYIFDIGDGGTLTPMLQAAYVGDYYANDINVAGVQQGSYTKADFRLFWDLPGNKVKLQFYLENIGEEMNMESALIYNPEERPDAATILTHWGDPMTYGLLMSYRW